MERDLPVAPCADRNSTMPRARIRHGDQPQRRIQGGISNGQDIVFRVAFKPVATLLRDQQTITKTGESTVVHAKGRHDPCVLPRAVPIVEAMAAMVLADAYLQQRTVASEID